MPEETTGPTGEGPPSFPGDAPRVPAPPVAPPPVDPPAMPSPAPAGGPPSFPGNAPPPPSSGPPTYPPGGGYPPPQAGYPPPYAGGAGATGGAPYATWGIRLGGYLIDAVIFVPVIIVLAILFRHTHVLAIHFHTRRSGVSQRRTFSLLSVLITAVGFLAYATILCGGPRGQTVGMMAVGVRVVRQGTHQVLGYGRAFGRAILEQVLRLLGFASIFLGIIWVIDMLYPLWDGKRQTLHDKATGTVVLRVRDTG